MIIFCLWLLNIFLTLMVFIIKKPLKSPLIIKMILKKNLTIIYGQSQKNVCLQKLIFKFFSFKLKMAAQTKKILA